MKRPEILTGEWVTSPDAVPDGYVQITVYSVTTGNRIATVFEDPAIAQAFAKLPSLLEALEFLLGHCDPSDRRHVIPAEVSRVARAALTEALTPHPCADSTASPS